MNKGDKYTCGQQISDIHLHSIFHCKKPIFPTKRIQNFQFLYTLELIGLYYTKRKQWSHGTLEKCITTLPHGYHLFPVKAEKKWMNKKDPEKTESGKSYNHYKVFSNEKQDSKKTKTTTLLSAQLQARGRGSPGQMANLS